MGYSKRHIEETRNRIVARAGELFRTAGYNGVGIDKIMNSAGLTRGGFYAHFRSKADLFKAVVGNDFDFTRQVRKLRRNASQDIESKAMFAIQYYLGTPTRNHIALACTMASSAIDVSGATDGTKAEFGARLSNLVDELRMAFHEDGVEIEDDAIMALVSTCVGGLILSRACNEAMAGQILAACRASVQEAALID